MPDVPGDILKTADTISSFLCNLESPQNVAKRCKANKVFGTRPTHDQLVGIKGWFDGPIQNLVKKIYPEVGTISCDAWHVQFYLKCFPRPALINLDQHHPVWNFIRELTEGKHSDLIIGESKP